MEKIKAILPIFLAVFFMSFLLMPVPAMATEAYAEFHHLALDGGESDISVAPGALICVDVGFGYVAPTGIHKNDLVEIVVSFDYGPLGCLIGEIAQADLLGGHDYSRVFGIEAPMEPGTYYFRYGKSEGCTCEQAKNLFNVAHEIGSVTVVAEEEDEKDNEWKLLHQSNITLTSLFGDRPYTIAFFQRRNDQLVVQDLRVQIETPGDQEVETGKVFISVDEDVTVRYDTGCVYASEIGIEDSDFFKLEPGASESCKTPEAFFNLIMGFVPYSGMFASTINLGVAMYEDTKKEYEVNEELDLARVADAWPHEYFTTNRFQNERDVITIPWALDRSHGKQAIRVDCPRLEFSSVGTHMVVFCVIVDVYNVKVRHTIALPVEIKKKAVKKGW